LCITEDLVPRAEAASRIEIALGDIGGKSFHLVVQTGEDLLAVRVSDRHGLDAGADHAKRGLMQVYENSFGRLGSGGGSEHGEDNGVMPDRLSRHLAQPLNVRRGPRPALGKGEQLSTHVSAGVT